MNASQIISAATVKCTSEGYTSYPALCVLLENKLRQACAEIAMFKGENATPQRGASFLHSYFGAAPVVVEYEFEGGGGDGWNEPRYEPQVTILGVFLNGCWCDAEDVASQVVIQRWSDEIWQARADEQEAHAESLAEARAQDRRDRACME